MQIKVLFNKDALNKKFHTGWGLSFLIGEEILFDTGEKGEWLLENIKSLKVDIDKIEVIIISHDHWDHTGGLWTLLEKKRFKVYGLKGFSEKFKMRVRSLNSELLEKEGFSEIKRNIFTTGEVLATYKGMSLSEQALVIKTNKGISVITGCSHPGILKILKLVKSYFKRDNFYFVGGGFHLIDKEQIQLQFLTEEFGKLKVSKVGPTHCSGYEAEELFRKNYKDNFVSLEVGKSLEV